VSEEEDPPGVSSLEEEPPAGVEEEEPPSTSPPSLCSSECLLTMDDLMSQKTATCIINGVNLTKEFSKLVSNIRCKLKYIHNRINII
jgi:hypothetical protein